MISGDFAKKSEEVNDNLKRLGLQSKATGIAIAADLLPPIIACSANTWTPNCPASRF